MVILMRRVIWPVLLAAVVWTACGQDESPPVRLDLIPTPDPTTAAALEALSPSSGFYHQSGVESMEEIIFHTDVIARVSLLSKRTDVKQVDTRWYPVLEFRFRVHEYLKGAGGNEIGGLVYLWPEPTKAEARTVAAQMPDAHDSRWDNRQAIVFLETELRVTGLPDVLQGGTDQHWFGPMKILFVYGISVSSPHSKRWLPEVAQSAGGRTTDPSKNLFLTDDPLTTGSGGGSGVATKNAASALPTISLGTLKTRISALEAEASAGGTAEYRACIEQGYARLRHGAYYKEALPGGWRFDYTIPSGLPAGTVINDREGSSTRNLNEPPIVWEFIGLDREIVRYNQVNYRPRSTGSDVYEYTHRLVTTRPLPADTYKYHPHWRPAYCTQDLSSIEKDSVVYLNVTAPDRSVHEAFFDPVAIGEAVGSDDLSPANFSLDGASATITSLKWQNGTVTMKLKPSASLAGYAIDFIALDGSVALTLSFDDASSAKTPTDLTWSVADQPWQAGDLLMLRIGPAAK